MTVLRHFAYKLDKSSFLNIRLWEFGINNLRRFFPWYFLFRLMVLHPVTTLRGWVTYARLVSRSKGASLCGTASDQTVLNAIAEGRRFLVAPGFCLKPYNESLDRSTCPAGHFSHKCVLLDSGGKLLFEKKKWPQPCFSCGIPQWAQTAARLGGDFYLMTSAIDIARDVYLPALQRHGARYGFFLLCPYSTEPFTFGLAMSGMSGCLYTFCSGGCATHEEWTKADRGEKRAQTRLADDHIAPLLDALKTLPSVINVSFDYRNHVYHCSFD